MELATYAAEAAVEERHWWFVGRRRLFARLIRQLPVDVESAILDVGTSTGTNLRLLRSLGFRQALGIDLSPEAIRYCAAKGLGPIHQGDICHLPFADETFALVLATDVLEHLDDDGRALSELYRVLKPGGHVLVTVPAFPSLWGLQDEVAQHKRRYRKGQLLERLQQARFDCGQVFHFNFVLFGPIWLARQVIRHCQVQLRSENDVNSPLLNYLLTAIFALDVRVASWLRPPFGVSLLALCSKPSIAANRAVKPAPRAA